MGKIVFTAYLLGLSGSLFHLYKNPTFFQHMHFLAPFGCLAIAVFLFFYLLPVNEGRVGGSTGILNNKDNAHYRSNVKDAVNEYYDMFGKDSRKEGVEHEQLKTKRTEKYTTMINHFYDLVTDFYEYGWGQSFHFAQRWKGEEFQESIRRAEYYISSRIGLNKSTYASDWGCGVGGPMRNIVRFSGSRVLGLNNNDYQIKLGRRYNADLGLDKLCDFHKCDFMKSGIPDETFDAAYAIEATCHAPDKVKCFSEIYRTLKPGGYFAAYEWCVTPTYDAKNPQHVAIKQGIEQGNSLPTLATFEEVNEAVKKAGFELIEAFDADGTLHSKQEEPWYASLAGSYTLSGFRMTYIGRLCTHLFVSSLEALRIAPAGSTKVSALLNNTALDLVAGGKHEIFTPGYFFVARKPVGNAPVEKRSKASLH